MTRDEFLPIYTATCNAYGIEFDKGRFDIYYNLLKSFEKEQIEKAFKSCLYFLKFFPKVSEICECIDKPLRKSVGEMWASIMAVVSRGGHGWEQLSDEEVLLVADCGGMKRMQNASDMTLNFIFNDFSKLYEKQMSGIRFTNPEQKLSVLGMDEESVALLEARQGKNLLTEPSKYASIITLKEMKKI